MPDPGFLRRAGGGGGAQGRRGGVPARLGPVRADDHPRRGRLHFGRGTNSDGVTACDISGSWACGRDILSLRQASPIRVDQAVDAHTTRAPTSP